jgi:mono/diheme cytochrome c family protein
LAAIGSAVALLCSSSESLAGEAAPDRELALEGKALYAEHCLHCHGLNMVNPGTVTYDLRAFPHGQKDRFVDSVINGKAGVMPPWGDVISLDDIDALWAYVLTGGHI